MNKITTNLLGGQPFRINEIDTLQTMLQSLTSIISKGLSDNGQPYIISGCEITVNNSGATNPTLDLTAGAIWYLDEIYIVDSITGQSLPSGTTQTDVETTYQWDLDETYTDTVTFKNGLSHDILIIRKTVLVETASSWIGFSNLKSLNELLTVSFATETEKGISELATTTETIDGTDDERVITPLKLHTHEAWTEVTVFNNANIAQTASDRLSYRKLSNGMVEIRGKFSVTSDIATSVNIFTLPASYLTSSSVSFFTFHIGTSEEHFAGLVYNSSGDVKILNALTTNTYYISILYSI